MKRKIISFRVKLSVPAGFSKSEVSREIKSLINCQCNFRADEGDIQTRGITYLPVPRKIKPQRMCL